MDAVVLAAGYSSRMGMCKPLLPLGHGTVLAKAAACFQDAGVTRITVVTGHKADAVAAEAVRAGCLCVHNPEYAGGMFTSVCAGVRSLRTGTDAFFLLPVDICMVSPRTVAALAEEFAKGTPQFIHPTHGGKRGHPPIISGCLAPAILAWDGEGGLKGFLKSCAHGSELPVDDPFILTDMDTPEDYERMKYHAARAALS